MTKPFSGLLFRIDLCTDHGLWAPEPGWIRRSLGRRDWLDNPEVEAVGSHLVHSGHMIHKHQEEGVAVLEQSYHPCPGGVAASQVEGLDTHCYHCYHILAEIHGLLNSPVLAADGYLMMHS